MRVIVKQSQGEIIICQKQAKKFPECCGPETEANVTEA